MTVAPCTTLSSRAAIASGRCFPSAFGMYVRRDGCSQIGSPVDPSMQILDPGFEVRLIVSCHVTAIHAGGGFALKRVKRRPGGVSALMWWRSAVNCRYFLCLAAFRTRSSAWVTRARLCVSGACFATIRVPLGPRPWLHRLCSRSGSFVRRLRGYSAARSLTSQDRASAATAPHPSRHGPHDPIGPMADPEISRFPRKERPYMPGS